MNKLTWEEFKLNKSYVCTKNEIEKEILLKWWKENDYKHLCMGVKHMYEGYIRHADNLNMAMDSSRKIYYIEHLEWKKDIMKFEIKFEDKYVPFYPSIKEMLNNNIPRMVSYPTTPYSDFLENYRRETTPRFTIDNDLRMLLNKQSKDKVFPKVEMLNFNKDKGTTTIKFKNGNVVKSKVNPDETFNEFTGVLVTLLKEVTGMTNQELQGYFKYITRKEIK